MTEYPFISSKEIENVAIQLLNDYNDKTGKSIKPPIPVFELIEYLGYDLSFETDGVYEDPNYLGGLIIDDKKVEINENMSNQEGRMHFTMAHEIGHIKLHVPILMEQKARENILCRKDEGFEGTKKDPKEWQADTFAAYLLMPTDRVNDAFTKISQHPITLKKKRFLNIFMKTRPARQRSLWIAENVINKGGFENVSKLAMVNRLIGLGLVRGLGYQKLLGV
jgi:Zn-dependent peptidase ImmA (M78 family)